MITPDTSVIVAAFARWHERHADARSAVERAGTLIAHVAVESYFVLTRLPPPHRAPGKLVVSFLEHHFPGPLLVAESQTYRRLLTTASERGIAGAAVHDALIGLVAAQAGTTLVTLDERAASTYRALACPYRLL